MHILFFFHLLVDPKCNHDCKENSREIASHDVGSEDCMKLIAYKMIVF